MSSITGFKVNSFNVSQDSVKIILESEIADLELIDCTIGDIINGLKLNAYGNLEVFGFKVSSYQEKKGSYKLVLDASKEFIVLSDGDMSNLLKVLDYHASIEEGINIIPLSVEQSGE